MISNIEPYIEPLMKFKNKRPKTRRERRAEKNTKPLAVSVPRYENSLSMNSHSSVFLLVVIVGFIMILLLRFLIMPIAQTFHFRP